MNDIYKVWNGEKIELTLGKICDILKIPVPIEYIERKDHILEVVTYNDFFGKQNFNKKKSVIFDVWPSKRNLEKYIKYIKEGVIIFSGVEWKDNEGNVLPTIKVARGLDAWYKLGKYIKNIFEIPTIGITGSVGKTTTTLFAESVFKEKYNVFVTGNNRNTAVEIIRQMILRYNPEFTIHIQESGGGRSKLVEESAQLLNSDAFGITKISKYHHIDHYNDAADIIADKTSFDRYSKENAFGVINYDDDVLSNHQFNHNIITYGLKNNSVDYFAKDIKQEGIYLSFTVVHGKEEYPVKINIVGEHNVYNALMVIALAEKFGLTKEEIQKGFLNYKSGAIRQSVREISGRIMYIDCFNVCSDSILSCVDALSQFNIKKTNRKIAIIGGENALGDSSYSVNFNTGLEIKKYDIDEFIFVGPKEPATDEDYNHYGHGKAVYEGAKRVLTNCKVSFVDDLEELAEKLKFETNPGDVILFKGIFRKPLFASIDMAFGTDYLIYNPNFLAEKVNENGFFGGYYKEILGTNLIKGTVVDSHLMIPNLIKNRPMYRIGKTVFANNTNLKTIDFGKCVKTIGKEAFLNCTSIEALYIPKNIIHIEEGAFSGCTNLKTVIFEGVEHIEKNVFKNCSSLESVEFKSSSCKTIEEGAFSGCNNLKIISPNSYININYKGEVCVNLSLDPTSKDAIYKKINQLETELIELKKQI